MSCISIGQPEWDCVSSCSTGCKQLSSIGGKNLTYGRVVCEGNNLTCACSEFWFSASETQDCNLFWPEQQGTPLIIWSAVFCCVFVLILGFVLFQGFKTFKLGMKIRYQIKANESFGSHQEMEALLIKQKSMGFRSMRFGMQCMGAVGTGSLCIRMGSTPIPRGRYCCVGSACQFLLQQVFVTSFLVAGIVMVLTYQYVVSNSHGNKSKRRHNVFKTRAAEHCTFTATGVLVLTSVLTGALELSFPRPLPIGRAAGAVRSALYLALSVILAVLALVYGTMLVLTLWRSAKPSALDDAQISEAFTEGTEVFHRFRGRGVVVSVDPLDMRQKPFRIRYDYGSFHCYSSSSMRKFQGTPASAQLHRMPSVCVARTPSCVGCAGQEALIAALHTIKPTLVFCIVGGADTLLLCACYAASIVERYSLSLWVISGAAEVRMLSIRLIRLGYSYSYVYAALLCVSHRLRGPLACA